MTDTIVLLHGSATSSSSWDAVARSLVSSGATAFSPDMLGYGGSPPPTSSDFAVIGLAPNGVE
jgi:pimeloyl-ACP methyl ester carboxylesterase